MMIIMQACWHLRLLSRLSIPAHIQQHFAHNAAARLRFMIFALYALIFAAQAIWLFGFIKMPLGMSLVFHCRFRDIRRHYRHTY